MTAIRTPGGRVTVLLLAMAAATALAGCYTVLKHPATSLVADGGEGERDCYSCHGPGGAAQPYDPLAAPTFDYYPDDWYGYYAYPWWWREYWHDDVYGHSGGGGSSSGVAEDDSRRHLWGRGAAFVPPALPPVYDAPPASPAPTGQPADQPQTPATGQQPGRTMKDPPATPPPATGTPGNNNRQTPPARDDSKKEKKDRHDSGGRGGE